MNFKDELLCWMIEHVRSHANITSLVNTAAIRYSLRPTPSWTWDLAQEAIDYVQGEEMEARYV